MAANAGVRTAHGTLGAATEDIVTMSAGAGGAPAEIVHHGGAITAPLFFRLDNVAVVGAADETYVVCPGERVSVELASHGIVRLICSATAGYSVIMR